MENIAATVENDLLDTLSLGTLSQDSADLLGSLDVAGGAFKVQWKNSVTAGAVVLALATTAAYYEVIDSILFVNFAAIAAYVFILLNVAALNPVLDEAGQSAMGKLKIAAICGIVPPVYRRTHCPLPHHRPGTVWKRTQTAGACPGRIPIRGGSCQEGPACQSLRRFGRSYDPVRQCRL